MLWRPEGWANPHKFTTERLDRLQGSFRQAAIELSEQRSELFEAGASAMLEDLRKKGGRHKANITIGPCDSQLNILVDGKTGTLVFIPDDK